MIRIPQIPRCAWILAVTMIGLVPVTPVSALDADNTTKTETFDVEPDWIGFQNHSGANDFGFSNTNNLGSPGEAGGNLGRDIRAWYADDVGELDPSTDTLTMSGRMWVHKEGNNDTEAHIGWFDKDGLGGANTPSHYLGFRLINDPPYEVRVLWQTASNQNGQTDVGNFDPEFGGLVDSVPFDFEFTYNPAGFNNQGQIIASVGGGSPVIVNLPLGVKDNFANFDRFGLIGGNVAGQDRYVQLFVDDVTYTINKSAAAPLGDFNLDNLVDDADFLIMKQSWLTSGHTKNTFGEVTGDGIVDLKDFKLFKESLYQGGSGSLALSIPEPTALAILALAAPFALSWRKRRDDRCRAFAS